MPGRGLFAVACLVLIALGCISAVRKLERERRLLRKLRARNAANGSSLSLSELTEDERDCARSLRAAGILTIRRDRCYLEPSRLSTFRGKRIRLALSGGLGALILALVVALLILHR